MERKSVVSSNVASIGYDKKSSILEVEFHNGAIYEYYDVPFSIYEGFINAASHGKYLWKHIRDVYDYERIS